MHIVQHMQPHRVLPQPPSQQQFGVDETVSQDRDSYVYRLARELNTNKGSLGHTKINGDLESYTYTHWRVCGRV